MWLSVGAVEVRCTKRVIDMEIIKEKVKKDDNKKDTKKTGAGKKCRKCSLDCTINRGLAVVGVPDSKKAEKLKVMFGDTKPAYSPETCKKR